MKTLASRLIGLTGGIATGKTSVSDYLKNIYNLPVLDADIYAREAVTENSPILKAIFSRYGDVIKLPDLRLNRAVLGEIIFNNSAEKQWLENQIHPYVRDRFERELKLTQPKTKTIVLAIPLLFEAKLTDLVTEIWVVTCDRHLQISRLQQRNGLTSKQAAARIDSQIPLSKKVAAADVVLDNNLDLEHLYSQVDTAMQSNNNKY
ncbi:dephospho-CoA kinase [Pleurocapsa sp. PCC 7319]|uniref:dephospho-CoA kinase n=1 Tax=Pleurocapsa sp. PCC 7319 TaxID=118161 RepID=UPI00034C142E|nr:dephospho-CoA kinase [Pleurocapsa sp. PCC 7319]